MPSKENCSVDYRAREGCNKLNNRNWKHDPKKLSSALNALIYRPGNKAKSKLSSEKIF